MCLPINSNSSNKPSTMDEFTLDIPRVRPYKKTVVTKPGTALWNILKNEAKFCLYLLILLGAVLVQTSNAIPLQASGQRLNLHTQQYRERRYQQLLQEQRSLVVPTPHRHHLHHRSVGIMPQTSSKREDASANGNEVGDYCQAIKATKHLIEQIDLARKQANATFDSFYHLLDRYTQAQHNETLESFYEQWSKHSLELKHPYAKFLDRNINIKPNINTLPQHLIDQEITDETLTTEFLNINETLRILESVYREKNESREQNKDRIRFDMRRENESTEQFQERLKIIDDMYKSVQYFLQQDLYHARNILQTLDIQPQNQLSVAYNKDAQQIEWLLFQEHLSIMKYLIETYNYLLKHCGRTS